jgi:hypothetical protein
MRNLLLCALLAGTAAFTACESCYDADLEANYRGVQCTMDCPGVCGCDGKYYCNGCLAAKEGIPVEAEVTCN